MDGNNDLSLICISIVSHDTSRYNSCMIYCPRLPRFTGRPISATCRSSPTAFVLRAMPGNESKFFREDAQCSVFRTARTYKRKIFGKGGKTMDVRHCECRLWRSRDAVLCPFARSGAEHERSTCIYNPLSSDFHSLNCTLTARRDFADYQFSQSLHIQTIA